MPETNKKLIVFDFDKTLTWKDTNLGFFTFAGKRKPFFPIRLLIYIGLKILRKLRLISNVKLKNMGLQLFIGKFPEEMIIEIS